MTQQSAFVNKDGVMKIKVGLTTSFFFGDHTYGIKRQIRKLFS